MANNYYGWNYGGVMDQFGGCYPSPQTYSMAQTVGYPSVPYPTTQYGPYGAIITSPMVQNVAIKSSTPYQDGSQMHAEKSDYNGTQNVLSAHELAFFNAAKNLLEEKPKKVWTPPGRDRFRSGKGPAIDPQQWKYCELCKCTCAGEQAFKAHLVGKAHKKKEVLGSSAALALAGSKGHVYCPLCEVSCSSADAYEAHIKGAKHQKVMKVQMKMGKFVPSDIPETPAKVTKVETPAMKKINFVSNQNQSPATQQVATATPRQTSLADAPTEAIEEDKGTDDHGFGPIGLEYIVECRSETSTAPMFHCKLCDCSFSDPQAKLMHSKGKRHRLQYKKKVDPCLKVDNQPTFNDRSKNQGRNKRKDSSDGYRQQAESLRYEKELLEWQLMKSHNPDVSFCSESFGGGSSTGSCMFSSSRDNQHIMAKHMEIYPSEVDLNAVQEFVSACERSLKMVSDKLADQENGRILKGVMRVGLLAKGLLIKDLLNLNLVVLTSDKPTKKLLSIVADDMPEQMKTFSDKKFKVDLSPDASHLKVVVEDDMPPDNDRENRHSDITCLIFMASSAEYASRKAKLFEKFEDVSAEPSPDSSPGNFANCKPKCRTEDDEIVDVEVTDFALRELMRTKWFQMNSMNSPACSIVVRILMDFSRRIPTWTSLGQWALELLVERCMSSNSQMSPASGLRRIFEVISSGLFFPDGPGLVDLCREDKVPVDAVAHMCLQEKEDITNSSQHALRLMSLGDIHKVLGIAKLLPPPLMAMKRPRSEDW